MNALIGHTGLIGSVLAHSIEFDCVYNSATIDQIQHQEFDTVYCAAPSGNRMLANLKPEWDTDSVRYLADCLRTVSADRFVLIGSVDAVHAPDSVYGGNRLALEHFAQTQFDRCYVVRLCTLIHPRISKNLLFDIRNQQYLDRVNGAQVRQYYTLSRLMSDIDTVLAHDIRVVNLVSEPISDQEVMAQFCPGRTLIEQPVPPYNLHSTEPFGKYVESKQQIFKHIAEYMND
jgi:hypothetical protein